MNQQIEVKDRHIPTLVKVGIFFWIFAVIFVYLLLFPPSEFWSTVQRLELGNFFQGWRNWLQAFFTAGYLE
jgi:hypothetical protein